jgi:hypothetical protein
MSCGRQLAPFTTVAIFPALFPATWLGNTGTGWSGAAMAVLVWLGLWHFSRKARQTAIAVLFLSLFFGLPMLCGFAIFALEWLGRLLQ